jgi:hypothetical protein
MIAARRAESLRCRVDQGACEAKGTPGIDGGLLPRSQCQVIEVR